MAVGYVTVLCYHSLFDLRNKTLSSFHSEKVKDNQGTLRPISQEVFHLARRDMQDFAPGGEPLNFIFGFNGDLEV